MNEQFRQLNSFVLSDSRCVHFRAFFFFKVKEYWHQGIYFELSNKKKDENLIAPNKLAKGYSILSGFGYDEVLHHLPLEWERLCGTKPTKQKEVITFNISTNNKKRGWKFIMSTNNTTKGHNFIHEHEQNEAAVDFIVLN